MGRLTGSQRKWFVFVHVIICLHRSHEPLDTTSHLQTLLPWLMFVFSLNCALQLLFMFLIRSNIAKTLLNYFWIISDMSQMTRLLREEIRWERSVSQSQMVLVIAEHTQRPLLVTLKERTTQFMSCFSLRQTPEWRVFTPATVCVSESWLWPLSCLESTGQSSSDKIWSEGP